MSDTKDLTVTFTVERTPDEVFRAINDVRSWWKGTIEGTTDVVGGEFTYRYEDIHRTKQVVRELVPGKRVVWHVVDSHLSFAKDKEEWTGTDVVFELTKKGSGTELRFTHVGLGPTAECYEKCLRGWTHYLTQSLRPLLASKGGQCQAEA